MWEPRLSDIAVFKKMNQVKSGAHDEYYLTMLPLLVDHVERYIVEQCGGRAFERIENNKPVLGSGETLFIAKALQHGSRDVSVKSRSMGTVSYSYNLDFPHSLYAEYLPRRKVKFHASR